MTSFIIPGTAKQRTGTLMLTSFKGGVVAVRAHSPKVWSTS